MYPRQISRERGALDCHGCKGSHQHVTWLVFCNGDVEEWSRRGQQPSRPAGRAAQGRTEVSCGGALEGCFRADSRAEAGSLEEVFHIGCGHTGTSHINAMLGPGWPHLDLLEEGHRRPQEPPSALSHKRPSCSGRSPQAPLPRGPAPCPSCHCPPPQTAKDRERGM